MARIEGTGSSLCRVGTVVLAVLSWTGLVSTVQYHIVKDHSGSTFFDGWDFYGYIDNLTWGNVTWVSQDQATGLDLAYVNRAGNAIFKVDNTTTVLPGQPRNSVRITTQDPYNFGSIWIADILHLPYGCSVWPAYWTTGPIWPDDGEIDIIEGINTMSANQMALHTLPGCRHAPGVPESGTLGDDDCSTPSGCVVGEEQARSYGASFAAAGGGVWATRFDTTGVFIWFWSRGNVPTSIVRSTSRSSIDDSDWGTPSASYSSATCDMATFFKPQKVIFDITLCGIWAGIPSLYNRDCGNNNATVRNSSTCYDQSVVGDGSNFDNAYFEIKNVRTYTDALVVTTTVETATATATATTEEGSTTTGTVKNSEREERLFSKPILCISIGLLLTIIMSYIIFGRAVKSEYLSLATLISTGAIAYAAMSRGKKETTPTTVGMRNTVPLNASSSEEEEFIRKYIEEAEKDPK